MQEDDRRIIEKIELAARRAAANALERSETKAVLTNFADELAKITKDAKK